MRITMKHGTPIMMLALSLMMTGETLATEESKENQKETVPPDYVKLIDTFAESYRFAWDEEEPKCWQLTNGHRIRGEIDSRHVEVDGVRMMLSLAPKRFEQAVYLWESDRRYLLEPVIDPPPLRIDRLVTTVILDPGHGGHDDGARSVHGVEKDFALDTAKRARELLEEAGFNVALTREEDRYLKLSERVAFANQFKNAIFVSIHYNSAGPKATGVETFRLTPQGLPSTIDRPEPSDLQERAGNVNDPENLVLARAMQRAMQRQTGLPDRGIKQARFHVITHIVIPAVLVEGGFVSNPKEGKRIATPAYRQKIALAITEGAKTYRDAIRKEAWQQGQIELEKKKRDSSTESVESGAN